jgi:hypothetical protein
MSKINKNLTHNIIKKCDPTSESSLVISFYLLKYCKLWVWDFDDTLIDTKYYYKSDMGPDAIRNRTDQQLTNEVPQWRYFKNLVTYLVQNGKYVAIASFGTYEIIKAYMDRIMGFNQNFFTNKNLIAPTYSARQNRGFQIPPNKNEFIYKIMKYYKIEDFNRVVLFDDLPSNIADAINIGIVAIQIDTPSNGAQVSGGSNNYESGGSSSSESSSESSSNGGSGGSGVFFGPWVMKSFDKKIENDCGKEIYLNRKFTGITNTDINSGRNADTDNDNDNDTEGFDNLSKNNFKNIKCTRKINCDSNKTNNYYSKYNHQRFNEACFKNISYDKIDFNTDGIQEVFNPVVFGTAIGNRKISTNAEYRWNKMNVTNPPKFINGNWVTDDCNNDNPDNPDNDNPDNDSKNWADSTLGGQSSSFWEKKQIFNKNKKKSNETLSHPITISEGFQNINSHFESDSDSNSESYSERDLLASGSGREKDKFSMNTQNTQNTSSGTCKPLEWNWYVLVLIIIILMMILIIYNFT